MGTALDRIGEDAAAAHAQRHGAIVLARNWRGGGGELDLVVQDGTELAFVEVKARAQSKFGTPAEGVTRAKVRRLTRAALAYLGAHDLVDRVTCRFDVI